MPGGPHSHLPCSPLLIVLGSAIGATVAAAVRGGTGWGVRGPRVAAQTVPPVAQHPGFGFCQPRLREGGRESGWGTEQSLPRGEPSMRLGGSPGQRPLHTQGGDEKQLEPPLLAVPPSRGDSAWPGLHPSPGSVLTSYFCTSCLSLSMLLKVSAIRGSKLAGSPIWGVFS